MHFNDFHNAQVAALPKHLRQYIVSQHYERYTAIDHAVWRYVMRQNYSYLKKVAYYPYIKGLERAGLSIEHIPDLQTMNDNLGGIGWGAVAVDGFIPPAVFMEFQAYKVLVIAADIRQLHHIDYTPTPDIIHESAGHAPIIADPDYNNYLRYFGAIGAKALFSDKDYELYDAIRELSILKERPDADPSEIKKAEACLDQCFKNLGQPSEMALLSRLHWWSVEYGLIGSLEDPKIYGAGLLSSIGESVSCMQPEVKKYRYTLETAHQAYDITKAQPQLFVTPDFQNLIDVLEAFADTMAFRKGGLESVQKAIRSKNIATAVYRSGLQVSGVFMEARTSPEITKVSHGTDTTAEQPGSAPQLTYIRVAGPCALAYGDKQLPDHGQAVHSDGFGSPVGRLLHLEQPLEDMDETALRKIGLFPGNKTRLAFESGISVSGKVLEVFNRDRRNLLISFTDCQVIDENIGTVLFRPDWGRYDMAVGAEIVSVYNGHADKDNYPLDAVVYQDSATAPIKYDTRTIEKQQLYQQVRDIRNQAAGFERLVAIWARIHEEHPEDWLCPLEILEILIHHRTDPELTGKVRSALVQKAANEPGLSKLISDGLALIDTPEVSLYLHQDKKDRKDKKNNKAATST